MSSNWSVRLLLDDEADRAMSGPFDWPIHPNVRAMTVGGVAGRGLIEDEPYVTFEMAAASADAAEQLAQDLVASFMRAVGMQPRAMEPVWVAPLRPGEPGSHRFLVEAKELFDAENYELAVVAAQIHLELQIRMLLERASDAADGRWAARLRKTRGASMLGTDVSHATVELLLDVDVTQLPCWASFKAHKTRRDAVVHEGQALRREDAKASIEVVQELWRALLEASR